jgi:integrase/recombinase XerD
LIASGLCPADLDDAIPTIAGWRLASLPRPLSSSEVERVIATCDPATRAGSRNRAILLLLVRLGLRAGEVATLRLADIDWHGATVQVAGKSRRASRLPLPQQVGDAIQAYLRHGRPQVAVDTVFLRVIAPWRSLTGQGITTVASRAIRSAGVVAPARGAHALRHSAAAEMLRQGGSLEQIRIVLRHRDAETTAHYAKVDLALLRRVAQPWPEVKPC